MITEVEEEIINEEDIDISGFFTKQLVVFNDDVNTFEHVIGCFCKYLKMDSIQAEQCAVIIHFKGKCSVKSASQEELEPYCTALLDAGLSAEIQ